MTNPTTKQKKAKERIDSEIRVWKGRAYLHEAWQYTKGIKAEKDTPLGKDPDFIKKIKDERGCNIIFLNDDFTRETT